jgi:hypothetical protein
MGRAGTRGASEAREHETAVPIRCCSCDLRPWIMPHALDIAVHCASAAHLGADDQGCNGSENGNGDAARIAAGSTRDFRRAGICKFGNKFDLFCQRAYAVRAPARWTNGCSLRVVFCGCFACSHHCWEPAWRIGHQSRITARPMAAASDCIHATCRVSIARVLTPPYRSAPSAAYRCSRRTPISTRCRSRSRRSRPRGGHCQWLWFRQTADALPLRSSVR